MKEIITVSVKVEIEWRDGHRADAVDAALRMAGSSKRSVCGGGYSARVIGADLDEAYGEEEA